MRWFSSQERLSGPRTRGSRVDGEGAAHGNRVSPVYAGGKGTDTLIGWAKWVSALRMRGSRQRLADVVEAAFVSPVHAGIKAGPASGPPAPEGQPRACGGRGTIIRWEAGIRTSAPRMRG